MRRSIWWIFLIVAIVVVAFNTNIFLLPLPISIGFLGIKKKYRWILLVVLLLLLFNLMYSTARKESYDENGPMYESKVVIKAYKNDFVMTWNGFRILIKNDCEDRLIEGVYKVSYKTNTYYNINPNTFNYERYLLSNGFVDTCKLSELDYSCIEIKGTWQSMLREKVSKRIDQYYTGHTKSFLYGLLLADGSLIDDELETLFRNNGTSHMLAISGLHIGVFYGILFKVFKASGKYRGLISLLGVWVFISFVAYPISAIRAFIMLLGHGLAHFFKRKYDMLQMLGLVGVVLVLYRPATLYHVGFQYSFVAILVIASLYQNLYGQLNKVFSLLLMPLTIQIGMMPITIYYNNIIFLLSFLLNLMVIPLVTFVMYLGLISLIVPLNVIITIVIGLVDLIIGLNIFMSHSVLYIEFASVNILFLVAVYISLSLWHEHLFRRRLKQLIYTSAVCYFLYILIAVEVYFLDVGQGDAIMIKDGFATYMIDSGLDQEGLLENILLKNGVSTLDLAMISHSHKDHIGGFTLIDRRISSYIYKTPNERDVLFSSLHGDFINIDHYSELIMGSLIFRPYRYKGVKELNNASIAGVLRVYDTKIALTGDIEAVVEEMILDQLDQVDILKVPHHGSQTSSTEGFVKRLNPDIAVICVGKNNYGHPNPQVVNRYTDIDSEVYLTREGCVKLTILPFNIYWVKQF